MATAAKQSSASSPSSTVRSFVEGQQHVQQQHQQQQQEDLDAIAKQISDHAEAIYQTWKARGLAPTEILNCQLPTVDGEDAFSRTLSPTSSVAPTAQTSSPSAAGSTSASTSGVAKLLAQAPELSNNSLEQLVSSFVNEDKARIAAQKQRSPVAGRTAAAGSAIKSVLQKFEQNGAQSSLNTSPVNKPNYIRPGVKQVVNNNNNNLGTLDKNNVPDVLKDTIVVEKPREKPQTPVKPEHLLNHVPSWPLKNRVVVKNPGQQHQSQQNHHHSSSSPDAGSGTSSSSSSNNSSNSGLNSIVGSGPSLISKNTAELMDEVSREEERLINALKTGTVLNNTDGLLPEVITSTLVPDRGDVPDYGYSSSSPGADMVTSSTLMANGNGINGNGNGAADGQNNAGGNAAGVKHWNGVPMKPNHIPILSLHQIHEQQKLSTNFTRNVATTRLPKDFGRGGAQQDKKEDFQAKTIPSPIRPFLSRGSVAERVLIFEKCPEKAPPRERAKEPVKVQSKPVNRLIPPNIHTTLQRHLKNSTKAPYIPQ